MNIKETIANLKQQLAEAEDVLAKGYSWDTDRYAEYIINDEHIVVYNTDGYLAGIVIDGEAMKKYFEDNK